MSVERRLLVLLACLSLLVSCAPSVTPAPSATRTLPPLPTAPPIVATPPPGPTLVLRAYMETVHERVLVEFGQRVLADRELLSAAASRSFDADILCPGSDDRAWQRFDDLILELSVIVSPAQAAEFHAALGEALEAAERSAESHEWFCTTYATFGQPADGMWARLSAQVRACELRIAVLHAQWEAMGGDAAGLRW